MDANKTSRRAVLFAPGTASLSRTVSFNKTSKSDTYGFTFSAVRLARPGDWDTDQGPRSGCEKMSEVTTTKYIFCFWPSTQSFVKEVFWTRMRREVASDILEACNGLSHVLILFKLLVGDPLGVCDGPMWKGLYLLEIMTWNTN